MNPFLSFFVWSGGGMLGTHESLGSKHFWLIYLLMDRRYFFLNIMTHFKTCQYQFRSLSYNHFSKDYASIIFFGRIQYEIFELKVFLAINFCCLDLSFRVVCYLQYLIVCWGIETNLKNKDPEVWKWCWGEVGHNWSFPQQPHR